MAHGFSQHSGIDYTDTYALVLQLENLQLLLSFATQHSLVIHQMDVDNTFLQADLTEDVHQTARRLHGHCSSRLHVPPQEVTVQS